MYNLAVSGLPLIVGVVDKDILNAIDNLNKRYPGYEHGLEFAGFETKDDPTSACNYSSFAAAFTQWTVDANFDQSINYTNNGEALKAAVNGIFKGLDVSDADGARRAWDKFCITQRNFFSTQGVFQISNCVIATILVQNGYNRVDSYQTQQVLSLVNYQCGAAFSSKFFFLIINNFYNNKL